MDDDFAAAMSRATAATRASNLTEATRIIREALGLRGGSAADATAVGPARRPRIDANAEVVEPLADARRQPAQGWVCPPHRAVAPAAARGNPHLARG